MLCPRALQSPHILELSGIGRRNVLEKVAIPVKLELPGVGENVQEHMFIGMSWGMCGMPCMCNAYEEGLTRLWRRQSSRTTSISIPWTYSAILKLLQSTSRSSKSMAERLLLTRILLMEAEATDKNAMVLLNGPFIPVLATHFLGRDAVVEKVLLVSHCFVMYPKVF